MGGARNARVASEVWGRGLRRYATPGLIAMVLALLPALPSSAADGPRRTTSTTTTTTTTTTTPPPAPTPPTRVGPGGSGVAWEATGRQVLGGPTMYLGRVGAAQVAWLNPQLVRPAFVVGTGDPGGPYPWGGIVDPAAQPLLVASFNGGFKFPDFVGGILTAGRAFRTLVAGQASFVAFTDGSFTVGEWGRDVGPGPHIAGVRQNLQMLVVNGAPVPVAANPGAWGGSVAGVATMRSGVGVDANGGLVWAGGRLSPLDLAGALIAGGAVRGMQLDINPDWVHLSAYQPNPGGGVTGVPLVGTAGANRNLVRADSRDFVAIFIRGNVLPGAGKTIGAGTSTPTITMKTYKRAAVERNVTAALATAYPGVTFGSVSCLAPRKAPRDRPFSCLASVGTAQLTLDATRAGTRTQFALVAGQAVVGKTALEGFVGESASLPATVDCGADPWRVMVPAATVDCTATLSDGAVRPVQVTVKDLVGTVTVSKVG